MRRGSIVACASALLFSALSAGLLAAGCLSNNGGSTTEDAGGAFDAFVSEDSASLPGPDASEAAPGDGGVDAQAKGTLSTAPLDFGLVGCGTGTASQTYTFANTGPVPILWSASVTGGPVFAISGANSGSVAPGSSGSITLAVSGIPTTSTAGTPLTATLTVSTNVPGLASVQVPLSVTPQGGSLTVSPALAGFGQVQLATSGTPIPVTISNVGNAPVTITIGAPTDVDGGPVDTEFGVTYGGSPAAVTIAAGASLSDAGVTFHPTVAGLRTAAAAIQTTDPLCASVASSIAMSGTGSAAQVTVGPSPLAFGTVLCGQTAATGPLTVTIKNSSPAAVAFTDALGLGTAASPFSINVASGTVPGGTLTTPGTATILVTPKAIPVPASVTAGAFNDTLTVTPTAPGLTPTAIALQESAAGAILGVTMASSAFGTVDNQPKALPFTVTNTGNRAAPLTLAVTGTGYSGAFTSSATAAADGGTASGNVTFDPSSNGADDGTLTVTTTEPLCSATPPAINLTATGAVPVAAYPTTAVAVASTCGGGAGTSGGVVVTNNGDSPLTISGVTSAKGYFTFTTPASIAGGGGTGTIGVTAAAIAVGAGPLGGSTLNDTLSFTTNEIGSPTHTVPVTVAVSGANLAFSTGNTATTGCNDVTYSVTNTGNMPGYVTATGTYPEDNDSAGDGADVFAFEGTFSAATLIPVGGALVSDTMGRGNVCGILAPCDFTGTQSFTSLNASGSQVGICQPLPPLTLIINVSTTATCEATCC
jgi:hypothetical protein